MARDQPVVGLAAEVSADAVESVVVVGPKEQVALPGLQGEELTAVSVAAYVAVSAGSVEGRRSQRTAAAAAVVAELVVAAVADVAELEAGLTGNS